MSCGMEGRGSIPGRRKWYASISQRPDRPGVSTKPSIPWNLGEGIFLLGQSYRGVKLTNNIHPVSRSRWVQWILSSGMTPVRTDVSEDRVASIIRVTRLCGLGTTLAITSNRSTLRRNIRATRRNIPEDGILHSHRRENLKSYKISTVIPPSTPNAFMAGCVINEGQR
jgi:hypothetical protein